jgi:octaprenyl-diphosphate synthase
MGAMSVGASDDDVKAAAQFGQTLGTIFQIRDDIFDYFPSPQIGKPSGNDMLEGKLTLPAIHCVLEANDPDITALAMRVKQHNASQHDIRQLVNFTLDNGGIEYAAGVLDSYISEALDALSVFPDSPFKDALVQIARYNAIRES